MLDEEVTMLEILVAATLHVAPVQEPQKPIAAQISTPVAQTKHEEPPKPHLIPPTKEGALPCDSKDQQPVLVGATTREAILTHRAIFRENMKHRTMKAEWLARWKAIDTPCTLVVAFGSWCSDSQAQLPNFLALTQEANPFVTIHYHGVYRDKKAEGSAWPKGVEPQPIVKVPTFWLFTLQPGGGQKLVGSIVETPPKKDQDMAEAVVELLEQAK